MRSRVNVFALLSAAAALQMAFPAALAAAEPRSARSGHEGRDRWIPSLALIGGLSIQNWDAAVSSEICPECIFPDLAAEALRPTVMDSDIDVTPFIGGSFELMTPELPIPTSPRLFIGGEVAAAFGTERAVALEGDPGELRSPLSPEDSLITHYGENSVKGQGSETVAEMDNLIYGAYAGISFPFEFNGRPLRVKPSVAWVRYGVDVRGLVVDAQCRPFPPPPFTPTTTRCNDTTFSTGFQREIRLEDSASKTFNGVGPGIDIEMDTGQFGPIGSSLFMGARFYKILGNRKVELSDSGSFTDELSAPGTDEVAAQWSFEVDEWMYRVGVGMRFQWLGYDD
jgi:hypothetical protein